MSDKNWRNKALGFSKDASPDEETGEKAEVILMLQTANEFGDTIYCYLKLPYENFLKIRDFVSTKQSFNPRDYGEIVAAGQGDPTDEVKAELEAEYGFKPVTITDPNPLPDRFAVEDMDGDDFP